jgi:exopolysaccharide biosynthesis polyprenyl glycosylphosphotransferase
MDEIRVPHIYNRPTVVRICATAAACLGVYWAGEVLVGFQEVDLVSHAILSAAVLTLPFALLPAKLVCGGPHQFPRRYVAINTTYAAMMMASMILALPVVLRMQSADTPLFILFALFASAAMCMLRLSTASALPNQEEIGKDLVQVVIVGTGRRAVELSRMMRQHAEQRVHILGYLDTDPSRMGMTVDGAPVLGTVADISSVLTHNVIDEVLVAVPRAMLQDIDPIAHACEEEGVTLQVMADVLNMNAARVQLVQLGKLPLLSLEPVAQGRSAAVAKRILDLSLTSLSLVALLPVMIAAAIAIKCDSKGPIIFVHTRVGHNKRRFPMFKFRTMAVGSDAQLKGLEHLNEAEGPIFKIANDPRVTRVGRFLRKTSIDELPQLINVLRGEMSLVGPRPMSLRDVGLFDKGIQRKRFSVKPGITGLWQVSGRSLLPFSRWLELDLQYIEHRSLRLDCEILFKTIPVVLRGTGAV